MLAYVFWHRPAAHVSRAEYEDALRGFHVSVPVGSASFRVDALPFGDGRAGYEDWYLVDGWSEIGRLNSVAVDATHRLQHDAAASRAAEGWGGIYALLRGPAEPPGGALRWVTKPLGVAYAGFAESLGGHAVWQRQMVLGPAPEFCVADGSESDARVPL